MPFDDAIGSVDPADLTQSLADRASADLPNAATSIDPATIYNRMLRKTGQPPQAEPAQAKPQAPEAPDFSKFGTPEAEVDKSLPDFSQQGVPEGQAEAVPLPKARPAEAPQRKKGLLERAGDAAGALLGDKPPEGPAVPPASQKPAGPGYVAPLEDAPFRSGGSALDRVLGPDTGMMSGADAYDTRAQKQKDAAAAVTEAEAGMATAQKKYDDLKAAGQFTGGAGDALIERQIRQKSGLGQAKQRLEDAKAEVGKVSGPLPTQEGWRSALEQAPATAIRQATDTARGAMRVMTGMERGFDYIMSRATGQKPHSEHFEQTDKSADKLADDINKKVGQWFRADPGRADEFGSKMVDGIVSTGVFVAGGGAARIAKISPAVTSAILGALPQGEQQFRQAQTAAEIDPGYAREWLKNYGINATQDEANALVRWSMFATGLGIGSTEAVPVAHLFSRLERASGGGFTQWLGIVGAQAGEEGAQEAVQQLLQNAATRGLLDPNQDITKDVAENFLIGAASGAIFAGTMAGPGAVRPYVDRLREKFAKPEEAAKGPEQVDTDEFLRRSGADPAAARAGAKPPPDGPGAPGGAAADTPWSSSDMKDEFMRQAEAAKANGTFDDFIAGVRSAEQSDTTGAGLEAFLRGRARGAKEQEGQKAEAPKAPADEANDTLREFGYSDENIAQMGADTRIKTAEMLRKSYPGGPPKAARAEAPPEQPSGEQPQAPTGTVETETLKRHGYDDDEIAAMSPRARRDAFFDAVSGESHKAGSRGAPIDLKTADDVATAVAAASQDHSHAQGEAQNHAMAHARWAGLDVSFEAPAGGTRRGINRETKEAWEGTVGPAPYGYIRGVKAKDGQQLDLFMGNNPQSGRVFVLDENDKTTGQYRQAKVMGGFDTPQDAMAAYLGMSGKTQGMVRAVREFTVPEFKALIKPGKIDRPLGNKGKPVTFAERAGESESGSEQEQRAAETPKTDGRRSPANWEVVHDTSGTRSHQNVTEAQAKAFAKDSGKGFSAHQMRRKTVEEAKAPSADAAAEKPAAEEPGDADEAMADLVRMFNRGETKATAEHVAEVEDALQRVGDPDVAPADIQRAAEIVADEGIPPEDAFPIAVVRSLVEDGHLPAQEVIDAVGPDKAERVLHGRGPEEHAAHAEEAGPGAVRETAEAETGVGEGRGETPARGTEAEGGEGEREVAEAGEAAGHEPAESGPRETAEIERAEPADGGVGAAGERADGGEGERTEPAARHDDAETAAADETAVGEDRQAAIIADLESYAGELVGDEIKSITLVGSVARKGAGNDVDLLYDYGHHDLPVDPDAAAEKVGGLIEDGPPVDLDLYDTFIKVGDRYFHVSTGAGRGVVENTTYAHDQAGKPTRVLAEVSEQAPEVDLYDMLESVAAGKTIESGPDRKRLVNSGYVKGKTKLSLTAGGRRVIEQGRKKAEEEARLSALPDSKESLIRLYKDAIDIYDKAVVSGDADKAEASSGNIDDIRTKVRRQLRPGPALVDLAAAGRAPMGEVPKWGQSGVFELDIAGDRFIVNHDANAVYATAGDKPFPSETGYMSFSGEDDITGMSVGDYWRTKVQEWMLREQRATDGKLQNPDAWYRMPKSWEDNGGAPVKAGTNFDRTTRARLKAEDSDEFVDAQLTKDGPWDFNDTWPALDEKGYREYVKHRGDMFSEVEPDGMPDAEQVIGVLDETLNGMKSDMATIRGATQAIADIRSGKKKLPRNVTPEKAIADRKAEIKQASTDLQGARSEVADLFGSKAANAMVGEARRWVTKEMKDATPAETPAERRAAEKKAALKEDVPADGASAAADSLRRGMTIFASGMSRPKDLAAGSFAWGGEGKRGIGVDVGELSNTGMGEAAKAVVDRKANLFVDSGAFSLFRRNERDRVRAEKEAADLFGENKPAQFMAMDFEDVFGRYQKLEDAIAEHNAAEEDYPRPLLVMPDIIGDQAASLALVKKYKDIIGAEAKFNIARPVVPIPVGDLSLADAYRLIVKYLGTDNFIVGIPSMEKAVSNETLKAFIEDARPTRIHFLGAVNEKKLAPKLEILANSGITFDHLSADANILRSALYGKADAGVTRAEAISDVLGARAASVTAIDPKSIPDPVNASSIAGVSPKETLVLMPCGGEKLSVKAKLVDLYTGPMWTTLRAKRGSIPDQNVMVLSGKHDFSPGDFQVEPYDEKMTASKADGLITAGILGKQSHGVTPYQLLTGHKFRAVIIAGAGEYRRVMNAFVTQLTQAGIIDGDAPVVAVKGAIGIQRSQLGQWLTEANAQKSDQAPAAAEKKAPKGESQRGRTLADFGPEPINGSDGNGEQPSGPRKKAFLLDAKAYLMDAAKQLQRNGFESINFKKNKPVPPVEVSQGGSAVSGDVHLRLADPRTGVKIYVTIGGAGVPPKRPNGTSVMARVAVTEDSYAVGAGNNWLSPDLTTTELVDKLLDMARRAQKQPTQEGKADERSVPENRTEQDADTIHGKPVIRDWERAKADLESGKIAQRPEAEGRCYPTAANEVIKNGGAYVIGVVNIAVQKPVYHAVVEETGADGKVYYRDPTLTFDGFFSEDVFRRVVGGWHPVHRMFGGEVKRFGAETGKYPDPSTLKLPPLAKVMRDILGGAEKEPPPARAPEPDIFDKAFDDALDAEFGPKEQTAAAPEKPQHIKKAEDEAWWSNALTPVGREMVASATGMPPKTAERFSKMRWHNMMKDQQEAFAAIKDTDRDPMMMEAAPTWAEILAEAPRDHAGDKDVDAVMKVMADVSGKTAYRDLTPTQQYELLRRLRGPAKDARTTAEVAKEAAGDIAESADAAMAALVKMFGGGTGRLGSMPSFDEETYARAKPFFERAAAKFSDFIDNVEELVRRMVGEMSRAFGLTRDGMERMRPYLRRFMDDVRSGAIKFTRRAGGGKVKTEEPSNGREPSEQPRAVGEEGKPTPGGGLAGGKPVGETGPRPLAFREPGSPAGHGETPSGEILGARTGAEVRAERGVPKGGNAADGRDGAGGAGVAPEGAGERERRRPAATRPDYEIADPESLIGGTPKVRFERNRAAIETFRDLTEPAATRHGKTSTPWPATSGGDHSVKSSSRATGTAAPARRAGRRRTTGYATTSAKPSGRARRTASSTPTTPTRRPSRRCGTWRAMGFKGGRVLEPSVGIGNFFGMMPRDLMAAAT
jgi:hypothetical protein